MKIFGFTLGKKDVTQVESPDEKSFALPTSALDDGAVTVTQNAYYGTYVDLEGSVRNELELITRYREMSNHPELESAIDDIVNESITHSEDGSVVQINTDNLKQPESIKKKITEEYNYILKLLNFSNLADDLFRRWYIDGRIYFHVIVNEKNPKEGIQELRYIDPRKIRKIREINKERDPITGANIIKSMAEYYVYNDKGTSTQTYTAGGVNQGIRVATDSIINVNSGLMDAKNNFVISPLHSAIRPLNQLRMIEDAIVVYRLCLVGDTRVKTNTGWKYIKDINEGDIVYSYWGPEKGLLETSVVKQWKTGTKQTYKVSSKHFSITGTDNHPILVLDRKTNVIEYVDIKNIIPKRHCFVYEKPEEVFENIEFPKIRDKSVKLLNPEIWSSLEIPKKEKFIKDVAKNLNIKPSSVRNFLYGVQYLNESDANNILIEVGIENYELDSKYEFLPKTTSVNLPEYIDEEFARLYGFMLGDGTISKNGVTFAEGVYHEQNLYYSGLLTKYFGGCTLHKSKNRKYNNYTTSNTLASELFSKLGFTNGAKIKRFPDWIWKCSDEIKKQFILGFCDADGCNKDSVYTGTWSSEIELCNKQLIEDIKEMWTSLGLTSGKLHYRKRPKETGVFGNDLVERTINERESWYVRISDYELPKFETIYEVVSAEIEDVYELEVQSEKHNFIANGICVHNSRAPERRVFYIDVGNLPKGKAEQYLRDVMVKYRNKMTYDASTGCLAMDTKVPLLDGRTLTISEISDELKNNKELWTYSCDPNTGKFAPGLITWAGVTQKSAKVMKITFDNGKSLICTLNHKHVTKDRGFVEAKDLQINDSMMPHEKGIQNEYSDFCYKIVNIEYLNNEIEVGTLTIDGQEKYHNYHTFALDCGIYTKNSVVDSRKHMSMLEDFFLPRREGCVSENTVINLLDGRKLTLKDLIIEYKIGKENWVYSVSPTGKIVPGKISWAGITRLNAEVLDIHLDNGEVITATPDHKFILRNGEKIEAKDLQIGSSLMPFNTRFKNISHNRGSEYFQIHDNEQNKWRFAHTAIAEFIYGPKKPNQVTHHIDFCRHNQTPSNLVYMDKKEHYLYHCETASLSWQLGDVEERKRKLSISGKKFFETEDGLKRRQEISEFNKVCPEIKAGCAKGRETIKENRKLDKETMTHEEYLAKWSPGLSKMGLSGTIAAQKKAQWERENLSNEEWEEKCKKKGAYKRQQYAEFASKFSLEEIINVIKIELSNDINLFDYEIGNKIQNVFPEMNLKRLRHFIEYTGGYKSISDLIHRAIGPEYINKKRAVQINPDIRNHKVVKIVPGTPQNVGTLTIDENHEYHDYHNFGLSAGIFVMNSRGTEITTLPAGAALNDLPDLEYFKKKLLQSLHVPYSRMDNDNGGGIAVFGRSAETSRDELKFGKFIQRLRNKFSQLFDDALRIQLALKGICTTEEWEEFKEYIYYDFRKDNNFVELREAELIRERMITLSQVDPYIGKYFSQTWVKKNILRMTDEEIEEMSKEMEKDGSIELYQQQLMAQSGGEQPPEPFDNTYDSETSPSMTPNLDDKVSRFSP